MARQRKMTPERKAFINSLLEQIVSIVFRKFNFCRSAAVS